MRPPLPPLRRELDCFQGCSRLRYGCYGLPPLRSGAATTCGALSADMTSLCSMWAAEAARGAHAVPSAPRVRPPLPPLRRELDCFQGCSRLRFGCSGLPLLRSVPDYLRAWMICALRPRSAGLRGLRGLRGATSAALTRGASLCVSSRAYVADPRSEARSPPASTQVVPARAQRGAKAPLHT